MDALKILAKYHRIIFLFLTLLIGIFIFLPYHDFQLNIAQGDHGRDLYCFKKTMDGAIPYRDYWWVYGPLMPYYYSMFYHLFGVNIHSILLGYTALTILSGLLIYLILATVIAPYVACIGATWFLIFLAPFEHTYNHIGGILTILISIYAIFLYIKKPKLRYLYLGLLSIFFLSLIKINFGLSTLASFLLSIYIVDYVHKNPFSRQKKYFYLAAIIGLPIVLFGIYYFFIHGLPSYVIRQCFPYLGTDQPFHSSLWESVKTFCKNTFIKLSLHVAHWLFGLILFSSIGYIAYPLLHRTMDKKVKQQLFLTLGVLLIFSFFNLHEFLTSGVYYRAYWIKPTQVLMMFILIATAMLYLPKKFNIVLSLFILVLAFQEQYYRTLYVKLLKAPSQYVSLERGKVYTGNAPPWLDTVKQTTQFLINNLNENETFLALVDDSLYYFLTGKDSPTRQLAFCDHLKIHEEQEKEIIAQLESSSINYVLISNRSNSSEPYLGIFGKTYCLLLAQYLQENFGVIATFGEWEKEPEWFGNHGVKILRRVKRP